MNAPKRPACFLQQQIVVIWCDIWEVFGQVNARHLTREKASWLAAPAFMLIDWCQLISCSGLVTAECWGSQWHRALKWRYRWCPSGSPRSVAQARSPDDIGQVEDHRSMNHVCFQVAGVWCKNTDEAMQACKHKILNEKSKFWRVPGLMQEAQRSGRHSCPVCFVSS